MGLNPGLNLAAAMSADKHGCGVLGRSSQSTRVSCLDFVAKRGPLTIGDGNFMRRGGPASFGPRLDRRVSEACFLQLATDQRRIVIAMRRARQKARRIVGKDRRERIRHVIGKSVFLDAIPDAE